jgi:nucleotide-binding universal stress UspA family protein
MGEPSERVTIVGGVFKMIVVGTDDSDTAAEAVRQAVELAKVHSARLHVVTAYQPVLTASMESARQELPEEVRWMVSPGEQADVLLRDVVARTRDSGVEIETHSRTGDPANAIIDVAEEQGADLIVVGNKGMSGVARFLLGSVPNKVAHHAPCDVLIVRTT